MNKKRLSKFLSLILRHKPEVIGITLDEAGWANVEELLEKMTQNGRSIERAQLEEIVAEDEKQRYKFSADGCQIRASQGHSIAVDLAMKAVAPPEFLYHGTATRFLESIQAKGLLKMNRQHVHLSFDTETARTVGKRHGKVVLLKVRAQEMYEDGHLFYLSDNKVWLTDVVAPKYLIFGT